MGCRSGIALERSCAAGCADDGAISIYGSSPAAIVTSLPRPSAAPAMARFSVAQPRLTKEVMIVRIDDLCPLGGVGQDADALGGQPEFPRLRVVPVGGERRYPDQFFQPRIAREKLPLPRHLILVTVHARPLSNPPPDRQIVWRPDGLSHSQPTSPAFNRP